MRHASKSFRFMLGSGSHSRPFHFQRRRVLRGALPQMLQCHRRVAGARLGFVRSTRLCISAARVCGQPPPAVGALWRCCFNAGASSHHPDCFAIDWSAAQRVACEHVCCIQSGA